MPYDSRRSGSCLCGGIQFSVTGDPFRIGLCHCKDCRKASGSTFSAFAVWPLEAFETTGIVNSYGDRYVLTADGEGAWVLRSDGTAKAKVELIVSDGYIVQGYTACA